jgi:hypothetical protein
MKIISLMYLNDEKSISFECVLYSLFGIKQNEKLSSHYLTVLSYAFLPLIYILIAFVL